MIRLGKCNSYQNVNHSITIVTLQTSPSSKDAKYINVTIFYLKELTAMNTYSFARSAKKYAPEYCS